MPQTKEKHQNIPAGYEIMKRGDRFGLYKPGEVAGDGEWLVSTPKSQLDVLPGLLGIFFTPELASSIYQELLRLARN